MLARAITLAALVTNTLSLGILFPAYFCPDSSNCDANDCPNYTPISNQISAHPDVPIYVIVNPSTGPGSFPPAHGYQTCIPTLKSAGSNGAVIGYVHTSYGARSTADIEADIDTYAQWGSAYRPTGIFFDEVSNDPSHVSLYASYASFARQKGFNFIAYNPGTSTDAGYFSSADLIVTFENSYGNFQISDISKSPSTPVRKQAVLLYGGPSSSPTSLINQLGSAGVGAVFITNDDLPNPWDTIPSDWAREVSDVSSA